MWVRFRSGHVPGSMASGEKKFLSTVVRQRWSQLSVTRPPYVISPADGGPTNTPSLYTYVVQYMYVYTIYSVHVQYATAHIRQSALGDIGQHTTPTNTAASDVAQLSNRPTLRSQSDDDYSSDSHCQIVMVAAYRCSTNFSIQ